MIYFICGSVVLWVLMMVFIHVDCRWYCDYVGRYGPQGKTWLGSGFYVWWKHRKDGAS